MRLIYKSKWVLIIATYFLVSCNNTKSRVCDKNTLLSPVTILDTVRIKLVNEQYNHDALFYNNNKLYAFDRLNQNIDVFDIELKVYLNTIHFDAEGPNRVNSATQIYIHNDDSIFLANDINQIFLINAKAKKLNEWNVETTLSDTLSNAFNIVDYTLLAYAKKETINLPFTYNNKTKRFIFRFMPAVGSYRNTSNIQKVFALPTLAEVSAISGEITSFYGYFPSEYVASKKIPLDIYPSFTVTNTNDIIIQYHYNSQLFINKQFLCAKSYYSKGIINTFETDVELESDREMKGFHQDEAYVSIINDPFNKLVYRVFQHKQDEKSIEGLQLLKPQSAFSIIAIDYAGTIIGEKLLPGGTLDFFNIVPTPTGILISLENSFNNENKEHYYEFLLLKHF